MDRDLISKKELLDVTGISYGQLYRWKRKQLIPEDWFIRKSTFTGQETFFPKQLMLARIDKIVNMKDDLSLDQLAGKLSPLLLDYELCKGAFRERNIVSEVVLQRYARGEADHTIYTFEKLLYFYAVDSLLKTGEMTMDEGDRLLSTLRDHFQKFEDKPCNLIFVRSMGISTFLLVSAAAELYFDNGIKVVAKLSLAELIEQLRGKLI